MLNQVKSRLISGKKTLYLSVVGLLMFGCAAQMDYSFLQDITWENEEYEDANIVVALDSTYYELEPNGEYVSTQHKIVTILTMKGKAQYSEASFGYYTSYDTVIVEKAKVISPEGEIENVPKENIKDVKVPAFGKFFLPNVRMKKIIFPNVEEGSSVEYIVKTIAHSPPLDNHFEDIQLFEGDEPIRKKVYVVNSPIDLKWKIANDTDNSVEFQKTQNKKKTEYKWIASNVKGIVQEPMMPSVLDVCKKLTITTVSSWEELSKWYYELCEDKFVTNDTINALVDSLLIGQKTREDSIRALYYYIEQNNRYVGTKMYGKKGGLEPFPATKTFRDKYGVCRDKAVLLGAMLRYAGFDAYTTLTNMGAEVDKEMPILAFNHAITAIKEDDGSFLFVDGTMQNESDLLSSVEQDQAVLVCTADGEDLTCTPKVLAEKSKLIVNSTSHLDENCGLKSTLEMKFTGFMAIAFRQMFTMLPPELIEQVLQSMITGTISSAVIDTFYYSDPEDLYTPLELTIKFSAENFGLMLDDTYSFILPMSPSGGSSGISFAEGNPFALEERKYPLNMMTTMKMERHQTIYIPDAYAVEELPENIQTDLGYFEAKSEYTNDQKSITYNSISAYNEFKFSPSQYKEIKSFMDESAKLSGQEIVLKKIKDGK